jgi:hypothetical protein
MAGRTALFVARDGSNNGTTPVGARLALGGLLAGNGASPLDVRAGVLVDNGGAIVSGAADMSYNVRAFRAVSLASTANGPTIGSNDASVNVVTTAAPGSNSRIDRIWARQHLMTGDGATDTDVVYEIGVTQGTVAASPSAPAIPSGAVALYDATVTAGVTATSGLTFTRAHNWTVANGGIIPIFTSTERTAITPYEGLAIWYAVTDELQIWDGAAWKVVGANKANPIWVGYLTSNVSISNDSQTTVTTWTQDTTADGTGFFSYSAGTLTVLKTGIYRITGQGRYDGDADGYRRIYLFKNGSSVVSSSSQPGGSAIVTVALACPPVALTSGDTLTLQVRHTAGASLNLLGSATDYTTWWSAEYLGVATT